MCNWGNDEVALWGNTTGNSWRTTGDIGNYWDSVVENFWRNQEHPESAGPGGWNDPDMLEVGNDGMTETEEQAHFALWAFVRSPLLIGCDLATVSESSLAIMTNP